MRTIDKIIIHCSDTPEGRATTVADLRLWHLKRGFNDIGYHYVIYINGEVHAGRPLDKIGAHCLGHNNHSIGICYIGGRAKANGGPKDTRTQAQLIALARLIAELRDRFPNATVHGHNEFANKSCPCFDVRKEYGEK